MCEPTQSVTQWSGTKAVQDVAVEIISSIPDAALLDFLKDELPGYPNVLSAAMEDDAVADQVSQWFIEDAGVELPRLQQFVGEDAAHLSAIDRFYHLSRFGDGHSESRAARLGKDAFIPSYTAYEVEWWHRKVIFDFDSSTSRMINKEPEAIPRAFQRAFQMHSREMLDVRRNRARSSVYARIHEKLKVEALKACEKYAASTSIGSPKTLRRFLEETILTSKRLSAEYMEAFKKLYTAGGFLEFEQRLRLAGVPLQLGVKGHQQERELRIRVAKIACGLTRTRKFLVPEWADVDRFWDIKPKNEAQKEKEDNTLN